MQQSQSNDIFGIQDEYLKFVNIILFDKLIEFNLINDHGFDAILELIRSGMLKINLGILKDFINDRNHFCREESEVWPG